MRRLHLIILALLWPALALAQTPTTSIPNVAVVPTDCAPTAKPNIWLKVSGSNPGLYYCRGLHDVAGPVTVGSGGGTVTSAAVTVPAALLTISGSPITTSGTFALALATQTANTLFGGPASGSPATPTFRTMVAADIPDGLVTLAKLANLANGTIICRTTAGTGVPEACTTLPTAAEPAHTGDVTNSAGSLALAITNGAVTLAKLANLANGVVICRTTAGTGVPEACATIPTAALPAFAGGDVTSAGGTLVLTIANNAVTTAKINNGAVTEAKISLADVTTGDVSTAAHGWAPKLDNVISHFFNGQGGYTQVPIATGISGLGSNVATFLATPSSANLFAALTDETGSAAGAVAVFNKSPVIETPTIASFVNATHDHSNAAGGGTVAFASLGSKPTTFSGYGLSDSSTNLRAALSDPSGTGAALFGTAPTINQPKTFRAQTAAKTSNYTVLTTDEIMPCDASGGAVTLTLPTSASVLGKGYTFIKVDSSTNACIVAAAASQTINLAASQNIVSQGAGFSVSSDNVSNWIVTSDVSPSVADPGADTIFYFKNSNKTPTALAYSTGLSLSSGTLTLNIGGTCTNQFIRSQSSVGAVTCAAVSLTADVSGDLPFASLAQIAGLSVLGVTGSSTADVAAITAGSDNQVMRRSGTALGFGAVNLASSNAVTSFLPVGNICTATNADNTHFLRGDCTWQVPAGSGDVVSGGANTYTSGLQDFSAVTLKLPVAGGAAPATNGLIQYDSTAHMLHAAQASADAMIPQFTITPADNDCVKWVVSGSKYKLGTAGAACGAGGGGDFSSNTSTSVVGEMVLFSDTGGKTGKRATGSGIVTATSGVYGTVTAPNGLIVGASQGNTWSTGAQDMSAATSHLIPIGAGYAPTANGSIGFDSTLKAYVRGEGGLFTVTQGGTLDSQINGDTNDSSSGSGSDYAHTLTKVLTQPYLNVAGRVLRITEMWKWVSGSAPPNIQFKLKFGSTTLFSQSAAAAPAASLTRYETFVYYLVVLTTGATGTVQVAPMVMPGAANNTQENATGTVTVDLTANQTLTHVSNWSAVGTGTSSVTLMMATVEVVR